MNPLSMSEQDHIDVALAELELYAADAWSNLAIVERVQNIRRLRMIERIRAIQPPDVKEDDGRLVVTSETRWA